MVVPAKRLSRARSRKRRYQKEKIRKIQLQPCKNCGTLVLAHRICPECGYYKGKQIIISKTKREKK